mgnify:FL=1
MSPLIDFHTHKPTAEGVITPRCFGVHPWHSADHGLDWYAANREQFENAEIIGECGLDKCCDTPWQVQYQVFMWQIEIAEQLGKPLVLHCVHAFNELMQLRRSHSATPWVVHGFTGSPELYRQLLTNGIEVSFGAALMQPWRKKLLGTFATVAPDRIFLETDDSGANIADIYRTAAALLQITTESLCDAINAHYHTLLGHLTANRHETVRHNNNSQ